MKFEVLKLRTVFASLWFLVFSAFNLFAQTYSVFGTVKDENGTPLSDVTVTFTGWDIERTTTTNINGYYILSELPAGIYVSVTPSKTDYRFNPNNGFVDLLNANKEINFTGTKIPGYYSVSGTIRNEDGVPVSGIEITIGCYGDGYIELVKHTTSDNNGYYIISNLPSGCVNYLLTPRSTDYYFDPPSIFFENLNSDMTFNLTCRGGKQFHSISGTITEANGTPISGAGISFFYSGNSYETVTDINGYYIISNLPESEGRIILVPFHIDYFFDPFHVIIYDLKSNLTQDFIGTKKVPYIQLSGTIKNKNGVPINDITVKLNDTPERTITTDINGFYSFQNVVPGNYNYTITPLKYGFAFNPPYIYIFDANTDITNLDFIGHERSLYTVSGTIKDTDNKPISDVLVIFYDVFGRTYDTTTTDINGFYIFHDLFEVESYCEITPSHTKYYFDPQSVTITSLNSNQIQNFTAKALTSVNKPDELPTGYSLEQNYPNPFNPTTKIEYLLPEASMVNLAVYNSLGQKVASLVNEHKSAGKHIVDFNANNLPSGIYFYKLQSGNFNSVKKMMLLK